MLEGLTQRAVEYACRTLPGLAAGGLVLAGTLLAAAAPATALTIELKDVAPDRVERQRRAAEGALPLPGTPNAADFSARLEELGVKRGMPVMIRIFKQESELEIWMKRDETFVLFATYPVCHWSGTLGPKISEGDKQTPEGFYTVTRRQLHRAGRWPKALNLGFPNTFDKAHSRTGSYILVHGGCSSVGCFAMTNTVIEEIFTLTTAALGNGQGHVPVHVFPFRMTDANLRQHTDSQWQEFWSDLREGYDAFERQHLPPRISICKGRYHVSDAPTADQQTPIPASTRARRSRGAVSTEYAVLSRCPEPPAVAASEGNDRLTSGATEQHEPVRARQRPKRGASGASKLRSRQPNDDDESDLGSWWQQPLLAEADK